MKRWDETWHRLREWTNGQAQSERLAAQILVQEGFDDVDPSHPLGGQDGGRDAIAIKDGKRWTMAVYFPRGQKSFGAIQKKFLDDLKGAHNLDADGMAFITNQEISLAERQKLSRLTLPKIADIFHLERITTILDRPVMSSIRRQFLGIDSEEPKVLVLGGEGGKSLGAGGGGGAAVGPAARGGAGGRGGNVILAGGPGRAPGAGGGGAGVIGQHGGEGGGGGEVVEVEIPPEEFQQLRNAGLDRIEWTVGSGGIADLHGGPGGDGGDTIVNFVASDGRILKSIVAKGGKGGKAGTRSTASR